MEQALAQVHTLLVDFPSEQQVRSCPSDRAASSAELTFMTRTQSLQQALHLARSVEQAASSTQAPSPPEQASALQSLQQLSVLVTPPASFCADEDDLGTF